MLDEVGPHQPESVTGSPLLDQHMRLEAEFMDAVEQERDELPPLANGFSFVFDIRPPDSKSQFIPPLEYTAYFSQRQVPIAHHTEQMYLHDVSHVPGYILMFADPTFADTVAAAAQNALDDSEDACRRFTGAIDDLGDNLYDILTREDERQTRIGDVNNARQCIATLIALATNATDHPNIALHRAELLAAIEQGLGLDYYRQIAVDEVGEPVNDEPIYSSHHRLAGGLLLRVAIDQASHVIGKTVRQATAGIVKLAQIKAPRGE